jgi:hypothetical protein
MGQARRTGSPTTKFGDKGQRESELAGLVFSANSACESGLSPQRLALSTGSFENDPFVEPTES